MPHVGVVVLVTVAVVVVDVHDDVLQQGPGIQVFDEVEEHGCRSRHGLSRGLWGKQAHSGS